MVEAARAPGVQNDKARDRGEKRHVSYMVSVHVSYMRVQLQRGPTRRQAGACAHRHESHRLLTTTQKADKGKWFDQPVNFKSSL
jgi:hypothetical protein